jgi:hypothetical protein
MNPPMSPTWIQTPAPSTEFTPTTRIATLRQRLRLWPLDAVQECPRCGLPAAWCIDGVSLCISPACDAEDTACAILDHHFAAQGRAAGDSVSEG